jgi:hypothetical protein
MAAAGPLANVFGEERMLLVSAALFVILMGTTAALPSVRAIRPRPAVPHTAIPAVELDGR